MRIAIVGCGFVADYYLNTLRHHPQLVLAGVFDRDAERLQRFTRYWKPLHSYASLDQLLDDPSVELVVNLTNPDSHYEISRRSLLAGKHVYSEKPLAMRFEEAQDLTAVAEAAGRSLSCAPCSVLGETFMGLRNAVRSGAVGKIHLVYANLDDGLTHRSNYRDWVNVSGTPWPARNEFETGCTLEHAAYYVTWLVALFGSVTQVTSFAACLVKDKMTDTPLARETPDFSSACLEFESGVVARVTCSIVAPIERSIRLFGEDGVIEVGECWNYRAPVQVAKRTRLRTWGERRPLLKGLLPGVKPSHFPLPEGSRKIGTRFTMPFQMDFSRGIADQASALAERRAPRISAAFALHINEVVLSIQNPPPGTRTRAMASRVVASG